MDGFTGFKSAAAEPPRRKGDHGPFSRRTPRRQRLG